MYVQIITCVHTCIDGESMVHLYIEITWVRSGEIVVLCPINSITIVSTHGVRRNKHERPHQIALISKSTVKHFLVVWKFPNVESEASPKKPMNRTYI